MASTRRGSSTTAQVEGGDDLERDRRDQARARRGRRGRQWNSSGSSVGEQSTARAVGRDQPHRRDLAGEAGEARARAVGGGGGGPGDGLVGDVAQVRHGQAAAVERHVEVLEPMPACDRDRGRASGSIGEHAVVAVELDEVAVGARRCR